MLKIKVQKTVNTLQRAMDKLNYFESKSQEIYLNKPSEEKGMNFLGNYKSESLRSVNEDELLQEEEQRKIETEEKLKN